MIDHLDGTDLHNEIRLLLNGGAKKILVVEGEDDYDLLLEAFATAGVEIVPGYGKPKTLDAAIEAAEEGTEPVRFLLDADFDRLLSIDTSYPENVVATEHYDLAMDVIARFPVVPRIVRLASGGAGVASLSVEEQVDLAFGIAEEFGRIRFASFSQSWGLSFDGFPFHMFIPAKAGDSVDVQAAMALLVTRTKQCSHDPEKLCDSTASAVEVVASPRHLVNGHDLLTILLCVGTKFGGAKSNTGYETQFILAAAGHVAEVPVIAQLLDWAKAA